MVLQIITERIIKGEESRYHGAQDEAKRPSKASGLNPIRSIYTDKFLRIAIKSG